MRATPSSRATDSVTMPELRKDPLIGRWVIIATERAKRPIDFVANHEAPLPPEDCPFCRGSEGKTRKEILSLRADRTPSTNHDWSVRVMPNFNPILQIEGNLNRRAKGMFDVMDGVGAHEVIVETHDHIGNLADVPVEHIHAALHAATLRINDLEQDPRFRYALWFKNYGEAAGAGRIPHARSQLIALPVTPKRVKEELVGARQYFEDKERCVVCDIVLQEREAKVRVVYETAHMMAFCPFAARFPFEVWLVPKRHACDFGRMQPNELQDLAAALKELLVRLKLVLEDPPYNYLLHTAPFRRAGGKIGHWKTLEQDFHWHIELIPRLTRVAGFEWGTGFYINPTPPEESAKYLREAGT